MKNILFACISLFAFTYKAQELKRVSQKLDTPEAVELFHVLKNDSKTKHGNYMKLGYKDAVLVNGYYSLGMKDSIWSEYYNGKRKKSVGEYESNQRKGVWEYYDINGELEQKYDFSKMQLLYFKPEEKEYRLITGADTVKQKPERPPLYIGGSGAISDALSTVKYPAKAKEKKVKGTVYVRAIIDADGKASSHKVIKSVGYGCDEEALRIVKSMPEQWIPALHQGKPVSSEVILPVNF